MGVDATIKIDCYFQEDLPEEIINLLKYMTTSHPHCEHMNIKIKDQDLPDHRFFKNRLSSYSIENIENYTGNFWVPKDEDEEYFRHLIAEAYFKKKNTDENLPGKYRLKFRKTARRYWLLPEVKALLEFLQPYLVHEGNPMLGEYRNHSIGYYIPIYWDLKELEDIE